MIALPSGISRDDLSQWLGGGFCLAKRSDEGPWELALFDRPYRPDEGDDSAEATAAYVRFASGGYDLREVVDVSLLAGYWPLCGSINLPPYKCAVHVARTPARQYRRTFTQRQVRVTVPRGWEARKMLGQRYRALQTCGVEVVQALFDATYPQDVDDAMNWLGDGWLTVALNPRTIIASDQVGKRMVYYMGKLAATQSNGMLHPVADLQTCRIINRALNGRMPWTIDIYK